MSETDNLEKKAEAYRQFLKHEKENKGKRHDLEVIEQATKELNGFDKYLQLERGEGEVTAIENLSQPDLLNLLKATEVKLSEVNISIQSFYRSQKQKAPKLVDLSPSQVEDLMKNWRILVDQKKKIERLLKNLSHANK
jgi:hypothetical protein